MHNDPIVEISEYAGQLARGVTVIVEWNHMVERGDGKFTFEPRKKTTHHDSIIKQLREMTRFQTDDHGGGASKVGSKSPLCLESLVLLDDIRDTTQECRVSLGGNANRPPLDECVSGLTDLAAKCDDQQAVRETSARLGRLVRKGRTLLGYDLPDRTLRWKCGECSGTLKIAADASSDVWCAGLPGEPSCGVRYPREEWYRLFTLPEAEAQGYSG